MAEHKELEMADTKTAATPEATAEAEKKAKTVIEGMESRRMFDNAADAEAYLNRCSEQFTDFATVPQIINGMIPVYTTPGDESSEVVGATFDPAVYTPDMRIMVAVLANRGEKGQPSTVKAIVVTPAPTLDAILGDEAAKIWLVSKVLDKELNHVAVRALRQADDPESVQDQMPLTLSDYVSSSRESTGGIMETFNTLFKGIIASLAVKSPAWAKARLIKSELKKALESSAYAREYYPTLEDRGDKPSLFVMALQLGKREAAKQGLAPDIFDRWAATRDQKALKAASADGEDDDFDLDDLAFEAEAAPEDAAAESAEEAAPAVEPAPEAAAE